MATTTLAREKVYHSVSECPFHQETQAQSWSMTNVDNDQRQEHGQKADRMVSNSNSTSDHNHLTFTVMTEGTSIRLLADAPKNQRPLHQGRSSSTVHWKKQVHFHPDLKIPSSSSSSSVLSPDVPTLGTTEPVKSDQTITTTAEVPPSEVEDQGLVLLWEARARESLAVALSPKPSFVRGHTYQVVFGDRGNTHTTLQRLRSPSEEDTAEAATRLSVPTHRICHERAWRAYWICFWQGTLYAGTGEVPGQDAVACWVDPQEAAALPTHVGWANAAWNDRQKPAPLSIRSIRLTGTVPEELQRQLQSLRNLQQNHNNNNNNNNTTSGAHHLARPAPIINATNDPDRDDLMDVETQRLLAEYEIECRKAQARALKFGIPYQEPAPDAFLPWSQARRLRAQPATGFITGLDLQDPQEKAKQQARQQRFGRMATHGQDPVHDTSGAAEDGKQGEQEISGHAEQVEGAEAPLSLVEAWDNEPLVREFRLDPPSGLWKSPPPADTTNSSMEGVTHDDPIAWVPEKVHLFSIDWSAFKQIRTDDIMEYFALYGPSYVEWLGDLSCNIWFQDKYSAARALDKMSLELPTPPPEEVVTMNREDGTEVPDLGNMKWRLGKQMVRKLVNDKHGRRGTTARVLLRTATDRDVLHKRPSSWPQPPPGYSRHQVLGPGSDLAPEKGRVKGKRQRGEEGNATTDRPLETTSTHADEHPLLSEGLKASRGGFTVEEMEAKRAMKRAKRG